jgi:long-chain acyl-CoA synthetase
MSTTMSIEEVHDALTAPGQMFEMQEVEVRGVPIRAWAHAPENLAQILLLSSGYGDRDFLVYEDDRWSFDRHFRTAAHLAHVLRDRYGVEKGDRVAVAMRNFPEWPVAFFGASAAGAIATPLNAWWTQHEMSYGLRDSGAKVLICDGERLERIAPELDNFPDLHVIVVREEGVEIPEGVDRLDDVLGEVPAEVALPEVEMGPEDDATLFYTSGTTGNPKGVLGTQRNICGGLISLAFVRERGAMRSNKSSEEEMGADGQNCSLLSIPFFHATGCHSVLLGNLAAGGKLVMMRKWDPVRAMELMEREGVSQFGGVPSVVWQVIEHPDFDKYDLSALKGIGYGGAPAAPELVRKIEEMFPGRGASNGYGLTETSAISTMNAGVDYLERPDSIGVPIPVCDVKIIDPHGEPLPAGEVGELCIKGPNVVKGYWNKPEATAEAFRDGWLHTGDLARADEEGFIYLVDRAKDMVIRGGENISSQEVEAALYEHPAVTDAAVIGIPHHVLGEEVGAVVHTAPGMSATEDELQEFVSTKLARFKVPVKIWFFSEPLPRSPQGKLQKRQLKDQLLDEGEQATA